MSGPVAGGVGTLNVPRRSGFFARPSTSLGWTSFGMFVAMIAMVILNATVVIPHLGALSMPYNGLIVVDGLLAGVVGLIAVVRAHERSWMVWLGLALPLLLILAEVVLGALGLG